MDFHTIGSWFIGKLASKFGWFIVTSITGILGVWLLKLIADLKGKTVDKITKWDKWEVGGILFLFIFCFIAAIGISFSGAVTSLNGMIATQNEPDFKLMIMNPGISDANPKSHVLSVDARIWNDGSQSVVVGWSLTIKGPDKRSFQFPQMVLGETNTFTTTANDGASRVFKLADSFFAKGSEIPIEHGGTKSGYVLFQISDTARDYLMSENTTYEVSCMDTHGKVYAVTFNWPTPKK
jgi:uncharacterized iron-regulated membrane protein